MKLNTLPKSQGIRKKKRRLGKGPAAGQGKTAGRGQKGQRSRSGKGIRPTFEGGQMPLSRKLPYKRGRGFTNFKFKKEFNVINVADLEKIEGDVTEIDREFLESKGIIRNNGAMLKILGNGNLTRPLTIKAHAFSESAKSKIEAAGGKTEKLDSEGAKNKTEAASDKSEKLEK